MVSSVAMATGGETPTDPRVDHPRVFNLIFWPQHEGFDHDLTADEAVDAALAYRAIEL